MSRRSVQVAFGQVRRVWLALALACVPPPAAEPELTVQPGAVPASIDLSAVAAEPGQSEQRVLVPSQGQRSFDLWLPERAAPRSLVILLHGRVPARRAPSARGARHQSGALVECLAAPALAALDPVIIAPRSETGQWWRKEETELVLGLAEAAQQRWPATRGRSVIAGYSNGGIGTWFFARLYAQHFTAAIPMAFNESTVGPSPLPIYAIQGSRDEQFDITRVRAAVQALAAQGQDVTLDEKYRGSHMAPCSYAPELANACRWLEDHAFRVRRGTAPPAQSAERETR